MPSSSSPAPRGWTRPNPTSISLWTGRIGRPAGHAPGRARRPGRGRAQGPAERCAWARTDVPIRLSEARVLVSRRCRRQVPAASSRRAGRGNGGPPRSARSRLRSRVSSPRPVRPPAAPRAWTVLAGSRTKRPQHDRNAPCRPPRRTPHPRQIQVHSLVTSLDNLWLSNRRDGCWIPARGRYSCLWKARRRHQMKALLPAAGPDLVEFGDVDQPAPGPRRGADPGRGILGQPGRDLPAGEAAGGPAPRQAHRRPRRPGCRRRLGPARRDPGGRAPAGQRLGRVRGCGRPARSPSCRSRDLRRHRRRLAAGRA